MKHLQLLIVFLILAGFFFGVKAGMLMHNILTEQWFWFGRIDDICLGVGVVFSLLSIWQWLTLVRWIKRNDIDKEIQDIRAD